MAKPGSKSEVFEVGDVFEWLEMAYERGWTDGLPVLPPTEEKVAEMVDYMGKDPQELIGTLAPKQGKATIQKVAANCVMAGCRPDFMPVVIAALQAMLEEPFNLNGVQATAHICAPLTIVSGPAVKRLGFNYREGVFGGGSRANATIGRAIRLCLWNIGGGKHGEIDRAGFSHPGRYTYCIAEHQEQNPWEPLHASRGLETKMSAVTVFACESPHWVMMGHRGPVSRMLMNIAACLATIGSNNLYFLGQMLAVIGPEIGDHFVKDKWSRADVQRFLYENARVPFGVAKESSHYYPDDPTGVHWPKWIDTTRADTMIPLASRPEDILVMVAGGALGGAVVMPGWGDLGGFAQTKEIIFPDG